MAQKVTIIFRRSPRCAKEYGGEQELRSGPFSRFFVGSDGDIRVPEAEFDAGPDRVPGWLASYDPEDGEWYVFGKDGGTFDLIEVAAAD